MWLQSAAGAQALRGSARHSLPLACRAFPPASTLTPRRPRNRAHVQVLNSPGWASVTGEKLSLDDGGNMFYVLIDEVSGDHT